MPIKIGIATSPFRESFQQAFEQEIEIIPPNSKLEKIHEYDLIIFSGGEDIDSRIYGESITYTRGINRKRDEIELEILAKALALDVKVFGVCRGHQLINAKLGGRLIQDLFMGQKPSLHHSSPHSLSKVHPDVFLKDINTVNSLHHQGVIQAGKHLQVTSTHRKIIESTIGKNVYTVQFHPEFMLGVKEIREFFNYFRAYVESNIKKKDFTKVDFNNAPSIKSHYKLKQAFAGIPRTEFQITMRASANIDDFISIIRNNSNLSNTSRNLQISTEDATHIVNLYERKEVLLGQMNSFNQRDEFLYERMEQGEYDSDDEFESMDIERSEIQDALEHDSRELETIKLNLLQSATRMIEIVNDNFPLEEPVPSRAEAAISRAANSFTDLGEVEFSFSDSDIIDEP